MTIGLHLFNKWILNIVNKERREVDSPVAYMENSNNLCNICTVIYTT